MKHDESVLVIPRRALFGPASPEFQGFVAGNGESYLRQVDAHGSFRARGHAETDPSLKQIIPYGIVLCDGAVFVMRRSGGGGEARLHHKVSNGVGGHVNPEDSSPPRQAAANGPASLDWVLGSLRREVDEELIVNTPWSCEVAGLLNDDSNSVGQVHFGVVLVLRSQTREIRVREDELSEGTFVPVADLRDLLEEMETWSAIAARALIEAERTSAR